MLHVQQGLLLLHVQQGLLLLHVQQGLLLLCVPALQAKQLYRRPFIQC